MAVGAVGSRGLTGAALFTLVVATLWFSQFEMEDATAEVVPCSSGWVALTYDDGPRPARTSAVLTVLDDAGVEATFFVIGYLVRAYPNVVLATAEAGHVVGNHSDQHRDFTRLSSSDIDASIAKTAAALAAADVNASSLVRPPGGNTDARVLGVIEAAAFREVLWDVDPRDWSGVGAQVIHDEVVDSVRDGSIVLLHDGDNNFGNTAAATAMIIDTLHARGFCFGTLNDEGGIDQAGCIPNLSPEPIGPFCDIEGSVFVSDILWLHAEGITSGCNPPSNDRYCPGSSATRGQIAAFLDRAFTLPPTGTDFFADDDGSTFEDNINRVAAAGITLGCGNGMYCPNSTVTRGQMAAFLSRALSLTTQLDDPFTDDDGSIFEDDIEKIAAAGITLGCGLPGSGLYCPNGLVTRGQVAAFLHRALAP